MEHKNEKRAAFWRFDRNYISFSAKYVAPNRVSRGLTSAYDCFVIGSDQVWNPDFDCTGETSYLPMVPKNKKISYAASFGISKVVENRERTAELLNGIASISVREAAGAEIVRDLTGRDAAVVLDPTLLLGPEDWAAVAKKPAKVDSDSPYVFKYMLGDDVNQAHIEEMAQSRGLQIIDVMNPALAIGPSEFMWLIAHSAFVCTDSFHASVFALLHHKPLSIYERVSAHADMSSRFDTLCTTFGLVGHRFSEANFGPDLIYGTDWADFESRLGALRADSLAWLKESLEGVALG